MFESWYADIGKKIKSLAVWSFTVEALGAIITGLVFLFDWGIEDAWWALLILIFGPIIAFVGSWVLYGFGDLIDNTDKNESNTAAILMILRKSENNTPSTKTEKNTHKNSKVSHQDDISHISLNYDNIHREATKEKIICPHCNFEQSADRTVCFKCDAPLTK